MSNNSYSRVYGTTDPDAYIKNKDGSRKFHPFEKIPVWPEDDIDSINKNCKEAYEKGVVKSQISNKLKNLLMGLFPKLTYYQYRANNRHWLICPISLPKGSQTWRNSPVGENTSEIVNDLVCLISGLTNFVVDKGVNKEDVCEIRFAAHLLPNRASDDASVKVLKGDHYDAMSKKDNEKYYARGCIYLKGCREVIFSADETTVENAFKEAANQKYEGIDKFTLDLTDGVGAYFTSPYMSGTYPTAWTNVEKTKGIQFRHKVIAKDNDVGCLLIFDFPFRTKELLDRFMSTHANNLVHLD